MSFSLSPNRLQIRKSHGQKKGDKPKCCDNVKNSDLFEIDQPADHTRDDSDQ